jgi:hypothetical protein
VTQYGVLGLAFAFSFSFILNNIAELLLLYHVENLSPFTPTHVALLGIFSLLFFFVFLTFVLFGFLPSLLTLPPTILLYFKYTYTSTLPSSVKKPIKPFFR